jgi:hypothetical protein
MLTLLDFLVALIVSGAIVYLTYSLIRFTAYCMLWLIQKLSFKPTTRRAMQGDGAPSRSFPAGTGNQPPPYSGLPT